MVEVAFYLGYGELLREVLGLERTLIDLSKCGT